MSVALALALLAMPAAAAADGQLGFLRAGRSGVELATREPASGHVAPLFQAQRGGIVPFFLSPLSWSGDGRLLLFVGGSSASEIGKGRESNLSLYALPAEGGAPTLVPGSAGTEFAVGLPDGKSVAVLRVRGSDSETVAGGRGGHMHVVQRSRSRSSLWIIRLDGGSPRQVTPWQANVTDLPVSAWPDGHTLDVSRIVRHPQARKPPRTHDQAMAIDLSTGRARPVGKGIASIAYSPDGGRAAIVKAVRFPHPHVRKTGHGTTTVSGQTDIYVEDLASGARTPISVGPAQDFSPSWDPSGERLSFVRYGDILGREEALFGFGDTVFEVNADGTCLTPVLHEAETAYVGVSWRPGAEHAAGPLVC